MNIPFSTFISTQMTALVTFNGEQKTKDKYIKRVKAHYKADEIIKGKYWERGKGCAVGCTIHGSDHSRYEDELGIPRTLAYLEDTIFEGMSNGDAKKFPVRFLESVPVGVDLSLVVPRFMVWLMAKESINYKNARPDGKKVIDKVRKLWERVVAGKAVKNEEWSAARSAAWSAARSAWSAAWSAESAARSAAYLEMADKLIELITECK